MPQPVWKIDWEYLLGQEGLTFKAQANAHSDELVWKLVALSQPDFFGRDNLEPGVVVLTAPALAVPGRPPTPRGSVPAVARANTSPSWTLTRRSTQTLGVVGVTAPTSLLNTYFAKTRTDSIAKTETKLFLKSLVYQTEAAKFREANI